MKKITKSSCRCIRGKWKKNVCYLIQKNYPKRCPIHGDKPELGDFEHIRVDNDESNNGRPTEYIHCARVSEDLLIIDINTSKVLHIDSFMKKKCR